MTQTVTASSIADTSTTAAIAIPCTPEEAAAVAHLLHATRKAAVKAALRMCIAKHQLTTYGELGRTTSIHHRGLRHLLDEISCESITAEDVALSAPVTYADDKGNPTRPGPGFFEMLEKARGMTIHKPGGVYDLTACEYVWKDEMVRLGYDPATL